MRQSLVAGLLCSAAVVGVSAGTGTADGVPRHDHYVIVDGEWIQVGPHVCENPDLHTSFHTFHEHVHTGAPTATGGVTIMRSEFCEPG